MTIELFKAPNKSLITEEVWKQRISKLSNSIKQSSIQEIDLALISAVQSRMQDNMAILLSGGLDSSLLAVILKKNGCSFKAFSVGLEGSPDLNAASDLCSSFSIPLHTIILSDKAIETWIQSWKSVLSEIAMPGQKLAVTFGVACVEAAAMEAAKKQGFTALMTGAGAEEVFAGYYRHETAADINAECWKGLYAVRTNDIQRSFCLARHFGVHLLTPFLDENVIRIGMGIPGNQKIVNGVRKHCLREAAVRIGLPERFAFRPKQAAQYGSWIDKAIERIARKNGFAKKGDYLSCL